MPVSASVDPSYWEDKNNVVSTPTGFQLPSPHRALDADEIVEIVETYKTAAVNAELLVSMASSLWRRTDT
jgi:N-ethylmaleimide reductase